MDKIQITLAQQITEDFKDAFTAKTKESSNSKQRLNLNQLSDACKVISVLDAKVKKELLKWFIGMTFNGVLLALPFFMFSYY